MLKTTVIKIDKFYTPIFRSLLCLVVVFCATYVYFVNSSISAINERRVSELSMGELENGIAQLEAEYLTLSSQKMNLAYAYSLGFQDASKDYAFTTKANKPVTLSYNVSPKLNN